MRRIASWLVIGLFASFVFAQTPEKPGKDSRKPDERTATPKNEPTPHRPVWHPSAAAKLSWRFREVSFTDMPLQDVFEHIGHAFDTNIIVRWNRLKDVGIEPDAAVSLSVRNLRLSQVIWLVFNQFDTSSAKLAYRADRDVILISTAEDLGGAMLVKVYDIEDLVANRLARPTLEVGRVHEVVTSVVPTVAGGAVGVQPQTQNYGSGVYLNSDDHGSDSPVEDQNTSAGDGDQAKQQRIQQLINVITASVEPDSWAVNGGRGSIMNFRGALVVRNTRDPGQTRNLLNCTRSKRSGRGPRRGRILVTYAPTSKAYNANPDGARKFVHPAWWRSRRRALPRNSAGRPPRRPVR